VDILAQRARQVNAARLGRRRRALMQRLRQPTAALRDELLALDGIGPETADRILLYAAGRPVFVADAVVRRVLVRHRLVPPGVGYRALQAVLMENLPRDPALFQEYHALLLRAGKEYSRRPRAQRGARAARKRGGSVNMAR
jgi:endonuclease-3 related protein